MGKRSGGDGQLSLELVKPTEVAPEPQIEDEVPSDLVELLAQVIEGLGTLDEPESAFVADTTASAIAAALRLSTGDASLTGQSWDALGQRQGLVEDEQVTAARDALAEAIALVGAAEQPGMASALRSLVAYGGLLEPIATEYLASIASTGARVSGGFESAIGTAEVVSAALLSFIPGDVDELVLELGYPTASDARVGVVVMLDTYAGPQPSDALVCEDLDRYLAGLADEGLPDGSSDLPVPEAIGLLHHGLWMFDHTLDATGHLDEESDLLLVRPLLDRLITTHTRVDYEPPGVTPTERRETVAAFTKWAAADAPELAGEIVDYAELLVDFAADRALDPLRWSQVVAVEFLHFASQKVMAPPDELACLPDLVRLMIRWSHQQKSWPNEVTELTLDSIETVQPLFELELRGGPGDLALADLADVIPFGGVAPELDFELVEPPIGGKHPEPFAPEAVTDEKLRRRATAIAEEATDKARDLFDAEFVTLVRRMTADLACRPNTPIGRGRTAIWASAVVYAVAQLNEIPGGWSPLAMTATEITDRLDGAPGTITSKAKAVRDLLNVATFPPEPRYQHSTSGAATSDLMTSMANLVRLVQPGVGSLRGDSAPSGFGSPPALDLDVSFDLPPGMLNAGLGSLPPSPQPGSVDPDSIGADCFVVRVSLVGSRPEIWRQLRLPVDATFAQMHQVLQLAMGWYDSHMHLFDLGHYTVGPNLSEMNVGMVDDIDEADLRLCDALTPGAQFLYVYDFGDSWEHRIVVDGVEDVDARRDELTKQSMAPFALLGGAMAGPPEDCGGIPGYQELISAMKDKNHPRRSDIEEWLPSGFNPKHFDTYTMNHAIQNSVWS